jgi:hypothetical protein
MNFLDLFIPNFNRYTVAGLFLVIFVGFYFVWLRGKIKIAGGSALDEGVLDKIMIGLLIFGLVISFGFSFIMDLFADPLVGVLVIGGTITIGLLLMLLMTGNGKSGIFGK